VRAVETRDAWCELYTYMQCHAGSKFRRLGCMLSILHEMLFTAVYVGHAVACRSAFPTSLDRDVHEVRFFY
jgi:hypothetical protein